VKRGGNGLLSDCGAERARWVGQYRASGLGLKQFAQRHGLRPGQLHYWVYGLAKPQGAEGPAPIFREVRLPAAPVTPTAWSAEVALPNGTRVCLSGGTEVGWAVALVEGLRRPCSSH
jgi:hypothetical protein